MNEILTNDLLLRALALEPTERTPVWVMRQAGRYLPEYREVRSQAGSFLNLCRNPELAATVTLQPVERFDLDAAIVFSDILTIPDGFGLGLEFTDGEGPWLTHPLRDEAAVNALPDFDPATVSYVGSAVAACRDRLAGRVPLIGFAGGPFTLACYMVDGRGGEFLRARALLAQRPDVFATLLSRNANAVANLLLMQAEAGADVLMVFDSWAGLVRDDQVKACLTSPLQRIMELLNAAGCTKPVIAFWRSAGAHAVAAADCGVAGLGVDWREDLSALSKQLGNRVALQGNLDPAVLLASPETIRTEVGKVLAAYQAPAGHIFNLGHGINKETPPEHMQVLVDAVKELSGGN